MARERIEIAAGDRRSRVSPPARAARRPRSWCALHGGTYTSAYFDVPGLSFLDLAEATGFTAVSLDRPGVRQAATRSTTTHPFSPGARTVLDDAIAGLSADRSADHPGIVIVSHSIGSAIAVHMAAGKPAWPLLGIALHGVNDRSPRPAS